MARSLEQIYGGKSKEATTEEISAHLAQGVLGVTAVTPANVERVIRGEQKNDPSLDFARQRIFDQLGITNEKLLTALAKLNKKFYKNFVSDWQIMVKKYPDDLSLLQDSIEAQHVRTNGTILRTRLRRTMRKNGASHPAHVPNSK